MTAEPTGKLQTIHRPGDGETARNGAGSAQNEENHAGRVERKYGNQWFYRHGEDGREEKNRQGVAADEKCGLQHLFA